jgi:hypothetical protein
MLASSKMDVLASLSYLCPKRPDIAAAATTSKLT